MGLLMSQSRSEEHTSELQSRSDLVCRLLLEKKKTDQGRRRWDAYLPLQAARPYHVPASPALNELSPCEPSNPCGTTTPAAAAQSMQCTSLCSFVVTSSLSHALRLPLYSGTVFWWLVSTRNYSLL